MMLDPARIYATALYLASIIIALFCALYVSQISQFNLLDTQILLSIVSPSSEKNVVGLSTICHFRSVQVRNKLLTLLAIILEFSGLIWYAEILVSSSILTFLLFIYMVSACSHKLTMQLDDSLMET